MDAAREEGSEPTPAPPVKNLERKHMSKGTAFMIGVAATVAGVGAIAGIGWGLRKLGIIS